MTVVVIGAQSRLGEAILRRLGERGTGVARHVGVRGPANVVTDYRQLPGEALAHASVVVNCLGTAAGQQEELDKVNVALATSVARQARKAGVPRLLQVSSFSIYGSTMNIDAATAAAPDTPYGRSKLAAERALNELASGDFQVTHLRLPALYGSGRAKVERLVRLSAKTGLVLQPRSEVRRSMMHYDLAAELIQAVIAEEPGRSGGSILAADDQPFTYALMARAVRQARGGRATVVRIPAVADRLLARVAGGAHQSLFRDSLLASQDNAVAKLGLPSRLQCDLIEMANGREHGR